MTRPDLVWTRLHLPRPLATEHVLSLLETLASDRRSTPVIFEVRADRDGVVHLLGCTSTSVHEMKQMLRDHLPGTSWQTAPPRADVHQVGRLVLRPPGMPLRTHNASQVTRSLLSALATPMRAGEVQVVQIVLGPRRPPRHLHPNAASPSQGWAGAALYGTRPASGDERRGLRIRAEEGGFGSCVRIGTAATEEARARRFAIGLQSALGVATAAGVRMEFHHERPRELNQGRLPRRWSTELACSEIVGLLGWPLDDEEYPGLPALHPKPLRPAGAVHTAERVFALSLAPGDDRRLGVSAADNLLHGVAYGPTSSGKSTALLHLIVADMRANRPVAVLDPKRQLVDDVLARVPEHRRDDVVVVDVSATESIGFNPLDLTGRDPDVVVDGIMSVFAGLFRDGFGPRTLDIFSGTLRTLARASAVTGVPATLADIPRLLTRPAMRRELLHPLPGDEALAEFWGWYESQSPAAQAAAISAPLNKLRQLLLRPALMRTLDQRHSPFRLRDIWRDNRIVLVPLNEALIGSGTAELLGSLVVADLWQAVQERATERAPEKRPGFVYVDEAPRFLHLPASLADALAVSRSMGIGWWLAAQYASQFPKSLRSAVDVNARTKIVFGTEYDDAAHFARGSGLAVQDFMSLGKYEAYANLCADGRPSGWSLVRTLPPPAKTGRAARVAAYSRKRWTASAPSPVQAPGAETQPAEQPGGASAVQPPQDAGGLPVVGRKRRQR